MLDSMLKRTGSVMVKLLMALLILSFAVWGIGDVISPQARLSAVANVGETTIQPQQFNNAFQREISRLQPLFNNTLDRNQARDLGLADTVLRDLVQSALFDLEARKVGVTISDALVRDAIARNEAFRNPRGEFDRLAYMSTLQRLGISEGQLVADIRSDLRRAHLLNAVEAGETLPMTLVEPLYRYQNEKRVAESIAFKDDAMADPGEPDAEALVAFHKENEALFTAPQYRQATFVTLDSRELAAEAQITDDQLKQAFDERHGEFDLPERRQVEQMLLTARAAADKAHGLVGEGRTFADVAKEVAGAAPETLGLGLIGRNELAMRLPQLADAAFALQEGAVSSPVESPLGWHLVRVAKIEPGKTATLDQVRDELRQRIAQERAIDSLYDLANKFEDGLASGATIEEAAGRLNLKIRGVAAVDSQGNDPTGKPVADIPSGQKFLETAFELTEGAVSHLNDNGNNSYFVVRVDGITPPTVKPLDEIKADVVAAWKARKKMERAREAGEKALERMKAGEAPSAVAAAGGVATTTPPFTRNLTQPSDDLPQSLASALFRAKVGDTILVRGPVGYHVARLKEVIPADPAADKAGLDALSRQLAGGMRNDLVGQYASALQGRFPVSINRVALDQLLR